MFSLNFSSASKGSFIAGKAKNMYHRGALFQRQAGSGVRDMGPPLLGNLGAKFSETSFPHCKTYFYLRKSAVATFTQQFKTIDSNNFTLPSMFSFQNAWSKKRKAVYTLVLFYIFIHFLEACENQIGSQLLYFLKVLL